MKAKERLERYGTKAYAKMTHKKWTEEYHQAYCEKYDEKLPRGKPTKYTVTKWSITMEKNGRQVTHEVQSRLHAKKDTKRDLEEAFRKAQAIEGESGWTLVWIESRGKKVYYHEETKITEQKVKVKVKSEEEGVKYGRMLKKIGYTAEEVLAALKKEGY